METQPLLTVGLALYNNESTISEALDSALNQSFTDFKIIISDDGSTDSSFEIASQYAKKDNRISVFRQNVNLGPYENWRELSKNVNTPYFFFLPPDDIIHPRCFENAITIHESNPNAILVFPKAVFMSYDGQVSTVSADSDIVTSNLNVKDRLIKLSTNTHACTAVYGIYKSKFLKYIPLDKHIMALDLLSLFTAAIHGDILATSEVLFYRRHREVDETPEETMSRYVRWRIYTPTRYSPYARFVIEHFKAVLKAKNISIKDKLAVIYKLSSIFGTKFQVSKKDIVLQYLYDLIILPFR
jgi:glycosyltransferase involved in cell wall biosynthesis